MPIASDRGEWANADRTRSGRGEGSKRSTNVAMIGLLLVPILGTVIFFTFSSLYGGGYPSSDKRIFGTTEIHTYPVPNGRVTYDLSFTDESIGGLGRLENLSAILTVPSLEEYRTGVELSPTNIEPQDVWGEEILDREDVEIRIGYTIQLPNDERLFGRSATLTVSGDLIYPVGRSFDRFENLNAEYSRTDSYNFLTREEFKQLDEREPDNTEKNIYLAAICLVTILVAGLFITISERMRKRGL